MKSHSTGEPTYPGNGSVVVPAGSVWLVSLPASVRRLIDFLLGGCVRAATFAGLVWVASVSAQDGVVPVQAGQVSAGAIPVPIVAGSETVTAGVDEQYAALLREKSDLEERVQQLEKSNQELTASGNQLRQKLLVANSAGKRLGRNLARRTFSNVSRHVAGMAGAAIPYVGAGVLVGMATLDVRDGCETLEDVNEMLRAMNQDVVDASRVCAISVPTRDEVLGQVIANWRTAYAVAAAWTNHYEARLPPEPPVVPYARAGELWIAVFGANPAAASQAVPMGLILPTPPTPPTPPIPPTIKRP